MSVCVYGFILNKSVLVIENYFHFFFPFIVFCNKKNLKGVYLLKTRIIFFFSWITSNLQLYFIKNQFYNTCVGLESMTTVNLGVGLFYLITHLKWAWRSQFTLKSIDGVRLTQPKFTCNNGEYLNT
jgi:hypothetical protein